MDLTAVQVALAWGGTRWAIDRQIGGEGRGGNCLLPLFLFKFNIWITINPYPANVENMVSS